MNSDRRDLVLNIDPNDIGAHIFDPKLLRAQIPITETELDVNDTVTVCQQGDPGGPDYTSTAIVVDLNRRLHHFHIAYLDVDWNGFQFD